VSLRNTFLLFWVEVVASDLSAFTQPQQLFYVKLSRELSTSGELDYPRLSGGKLLVELEGESSASDDTLSMSTPGNKVLFRSISFSLFQFAFSLDFFSSVSSSIHSFSPKQIDASFLSLFRALSRACLQPTSQQPRKPHRNGLKH